MAFTLDNFVRSILAVDAAVGDTSLVVALAAPPLRDPPLPSAGAPGILILQDQPTAPSKIEIVTYTGVSIVGTQVTLTGVARALEGTTAQAWPAGTQTFSGSTAAVLAQFATSVALAAVAESIPTSPSDIGAATAAQGAKADTALQDGSQFATAAQGTKADNALPLAGGTLSGALTVRTANDELFHSIEVYGPSDVNKQMYLSVTGGQYKWTHNGWYGTGSFNWRLPGGSMNLDYNGNLTTTGTVNGVNVTVLAPKASPSFTGQVVSSGDASNIGFNASSTNPAYALTATSHQWYVQVVNSSGALRFYHQSGSGTLGQLFAVDVAGNVSAANIGAAAAGSSRVYVQSADPGAVADDSLWVW